MPHHDFDLLVIGGGSGGVRAARMAAQRGARVALAEHGRMGGTCVNVGCIPKKLYSYAAGFAEDFADAAGFGWRIAQPPVLDWAALKANRAQEIARLNGIYEGLMTGAQVRVLRGHARLAGGHTVEVAGEDGATHRHTARAILIATGGRPFVPPVPGHELAVTSDDMFDLPVFPRRLVVVGGGYIGCEMASIFHGLGAEVTLIYRGEQVLRGFDDEVRAFTAEEMRKAGVQLRLRSDVARIDALPGGTRRVTLQDGATLDADVVLYATGRQPNVAGLGLDALDVRQQASGAIEVDEHFATSAPGVYALGDVVGRMELTPVALAEAMALVDHLLGPAPGRPARRMDYAHIPTAVFTHPPIGTVGLTEQAAREKFGAIRVYRGDFKPLKHTLSGRAERTLVKLIVDDASDRVVGLHMVGADAGEVVQGFAVALKCGATKAQFDATLGIHPTSAEEFVTLREVTRR
ncbi:MAG: glutathione-disulfide reductase [Ottowia sp.]|uniref:glutathione-disulfide reductase n=1 Tax=Ottowia sp. TaxID=1898956 RepID=UPI0039E695E4